MPAFMMPVMAPRNTANPTTPPTTATTRALMRKPGW